MVLGLPCFSCGRDPLGLAPRDAAALADLAATEDVPLPPDVAGPDRARDDGFKTRADACTPLTCRDPGCFPSYCGKIGDGCGGGLDCGDCATGWSCKGGLCQPDSCAPSSCGAGAAFPYCGKIGDGCGGSLDCTCPRPDWSCVGHVCNGTPSGCVPLSGCTYPGGGGYCGGIIGDGCGGVLDCSGGCATAGFVCKDQVCVDARPPAPPPLPPPPPPLPPPPPTPAPPPPPPCPPPPPPPSD
jgi:hypothetical protein